MPFAQAKYNSKKSLKYLYYLWYIVPYEKNAHFAEFQLTSYILFGGQCIVNRAKFGQNECLHSLEYFCVFRSFLAFFERFFLLDIDKIHKSFFTQPNYQHRSDTLENRSKRAKDHQHPRKSGRNVGQRAGRYPQHFRVNSAQAACGHAGEKAHYPHLRRRNEHKSRAGRDL